MLMNSSDAKEK